MSRTVKEHMDESDRVTALVYDANAMVTKLKDELQFSRTVLDNLAGYQHPKMVMDIPYFLKTATREAERCPPAQVIAKQINRINALLGDKA